MREQPSYPAEWLQKVPALVFACLRRGELRILLHPDSGIADGGAPRDIPIEQIPFDLRIPNTKLWVRLDPDLNILHVWRREE